MRKPTKQILFEEERRDLSDREIQMEMLYSNWIINSRMEIYRRKTLNLIWVLMAGVLLMFLSGFISLLLCGLL